MKIETGSRVVKNKTARVKAPNRSKPVERYEPRELSGKRLVILCLILTSFTFVLYWPVSTHPFADYDDDNYVTANAHVQAGLNLESVRWAITSTEKSNWHPLTWISHELDFQLYGLNPRGHHFTSLGLHVVNVLLLFLLLAFATQAFERSFLVAIFFAIHPLNVESVIWIAERKNVLSTVLFLLAIGLYAWWVRRPSFRRYALVFLGFGLSLASKPMVITLPCVLLLLDYWPLQRVRVETGALARPGLGMTKPSTVFSVPQKRWPQLFVEKLPLFLLSIGSALVTIFAQSSGGSIKSLAQLSLTVRAKNAVWAYAEYVFKRYGPPLWRPYIRTRAIPCLSGSCCWGAFFWYRLACWYGESDHIDTWSSAGVGLWAHWSR